MIENPKSKQQLSLSINLAHNPPKQEINRILKYTRKIKKIQDIRKIYFKKQ